MAQKEYIKRSAALHAVLHNEGDAARAAIERIPAEDVVPVVRCKKCRFWVFEQFNGGISYGDCTNQNAIIDPLAMPEADYYCPDGKPKKDRKYI